MSNWQDSQGYIDEELLQMSKARLVDFVRYNERELRRARETMDMQFKMIVCNHRTAQGYVDKSMLEQKIEKLQADQHTDKEYQKGWTDALEEVKKLIK